jgi:hypothetical protein
LEGQIKEGMNGRKDGIEGRKRKEYFPSFACAIGAQFIKTFF